jgi:hypothetical protein
MITLDTNAPKSEQEKYWKAVGKALDHMSKHDD